MYTSANVLTAVNMAPIPSSRVTALQPSIVQEHMIVELTCYLFTGN